MKCPGQDTKYWKPGAIFEVNCPKCDHPVEFFKDDTNRKCNRCGHRFVNPKMDFGCAAYCQYAEQCLGTLPEELAARNEDLLKDRVAVEVKRYLKTDFKLIGHATRTARYAERIGKQAGANLPVVLCAAYLFDIGASNTVGQADRPEPDSIGVRGAAAARSILTKLGAKEELIETVCDIIARHGATEQDEELSHRIVADAARIATLEETLKQAPWDENTIASHIESELATNAGKAEARRVLLK